MIRNKNSDLIRAIKKAKKCCQVQLEELSVTQNGEYTPSEGTAYSKVTVDVSGSQTELWLDVSFFSYPDDPEALLSFPFIEPPQVGEQALIKEPDGNVHTYDVIKNEWDEVVLTRHAVQGTLIFTPNQSEQALYWGSIYD